MIVFLFTSKFSKHYYEKFEIENFSSKNDVLILDISKIFFKNYKNFKITDHKDKNFKDLSSFIYLIYELKKIPKKSLIVNFVENDSFLGIIVNIYIKTLRLKTMKFFNDGLPYSLNIKENRKTSFLLFLPKAFFKLKILFLKFIGIVFDLYPEFLFYSGKVKLINLKSSFPYKNKVFVKGNSWDISNLYFKETSPYFKKEEKYILYIDGASPKMSDSDLFNIEPILTNKWYISINKFFDFLEEKTGKKIIIAGHPQAINQFQGDEFKGRKLIFGKTKNLVKGSSLVLSRASTANIFAIFFKKPIINLTSNEIKKNSHNIYATRKLISEELMSPYINIDEFQKDMSLKFVADLKSYEKYMKDYVISSESRIPNSEIINNTHESL